MTLPPGHVYLSMKYSGEFAPEWQKKDLVGADASLEDELNYFR